MRTLVISDLHLGTRAGKDVLRRPAALRVLLAALKDVDRLVLLGDTVELLEGRPKYAMGVAMPVLRAIGAGLGHGKEIVLVLGNHDHALVRPWLRAQRVGGKRMGLASRVPAGSSAGLKAITAALKPARVQVRYPGVWLGDGIWATHGHYLDRHLLPSGSTGLLLGRMPEGRVTGEDYERAAGPSAAAVQGLVAASLPGILGEPLDRAAGLARRASMLALPVAARLVGEGTIAPINSGALGYQFRRAGMPAMGEVAERLGVRADHVIFGHLHRTGPRTEDRVPDWTPVGARALTNSGCWVYEPLLLTGAHPPHPYWPGGAVLLEDDGPPRAVGLLDELDDSGLRPS